MSKENNMKPKENNMKLISILCLVLLIVASGCTHRFEGVYDATLPTGVEKPILTPKTPDQPRINGADIFGAKPGNQCFFKVAATGKQPLVFTAENLPARLTINEKNGVISGIAPSKKGEYKVN